MTTMSHSENSSHMTSSNMLELHGKNDKNDSFKQNNIKNDLFKLYKNTNASFRLSNSKLSKKVRFKDRYENKSFAVIG